MSRDYRRSLDDDDRNLKDSDRLDRLEVKKQKCHDVTTRVRRGVEYQVVNEHSYFGTNCSLLLLSSITSSWDFKVLKINTMLVTRVEILGTTSLLVY